MKLLIATTNPGKLREITASLAGAPVEIVTLADLPRIAEPAEVHDTFWQNARDKALAYARASGIRVLAEDSGLEIAALGGEPGVRSARFLGPDVPYPVRFEAIWKRLRDVPTRFRDARFVTALAVAEGDRILFETEAWVDGEIADRAAGEHGFGYDPIFFYPPFGRTTAELTLEEKLTISHRARAVRDYVRMLKGD